MDITGALDMNRNSGVEEQSLNIQDSNTVTKRVITNVGNFF